MLDATAEYVLVGPDTGGAQPRLQDSQFETQPGDAARRRPDGIAGQVFEFTEFSREGLHVDTSLFGSTFYILTGFHGAHVTAGIIWLLSLWGLSMQGRLRQQDAERVEVAGLYWHFVDVVWIVIFTVIYLVPQPAAPGGG